MGEKQKRTKTTSYEVAMSVSAAPEMHSVRTSASASSVRAVGATAAGVTTTTLVSSALSVPPYVDGERESVIVGSAATTLAGIVSRSANQP
jgi:osmotically-inducible protein OsmY